MYKIIKMQPGLYISVHLSIKDMCWYFINKGIATIIPQELPEAMVWGLTFSHSSPLYSHMISDEKPLLNMPLPGRSADPLPHLPV
jgi:hypothetical protein